MESALTAIILFVVSIGVVFVVGATVLELTGISVVGWLRNRNQVRKY